MYKQTYVYYENPYCDEEGYMGLPDLIFYEGDGLEFKYAPDSKICYVCDILEGVENVVTPECINTKYGLAKVSKWNVREASGKDSIKTIEFGKYIDDFPLSTCEEFPNLSKVIFNANVKWIPTSFFNNCPKLEELVFGEDSPLTEFNFGSVANCPSLCEITMPPLTSEIRYDGEKCYIQTVTISYNQTSLIPQLIDVSCVKKIIVKSDHYQSGYILEEADIAQRRSYRDQIKKEEDKDKKIEEKENSLFDFVLFIFNCLPFVYLGYRLITHQHNVSDFGSILLIIVQLGVLLVCLVLSFVMSFKISSASNRKIISILCPIITVPLSILITFAAIYVLSILLTFSTDLASIADPRLWGI